MTTMQAQDTTGNSPNDACVQKYWLDVAYSQTDQLLPLGSAETSHSLRDKRALLEKHLIALRKVEDLLRHRLNCLLPIYRLPDEILAQVLALACAATRVVPALPTRLMRVSKKWCSVIRTFPEVWAHPPLYHSENAVIESLSRSKAALINLNWKYTSARVPTSLRAGHHALWMSKCEGIVLDATTASLQAILPNLGHADAPHLETVSIMVNRSHRDLNDPELTVLNWPTNVFGRHAPRLRALALLKFGCFNWSESVLSSSLTTLAINFVHPGWVSLATIARDHPEKAHDCSFDGLLDALERMQNLQSLTLRDCITTSIVLGSPTRQRTIKTPSLRRISVHDSPDACSALYRALSLDDKMRAVFAFKYTGPQSLESIKQFMCSISIEGRFTILQSSVWRLRSREQQDHVTFDLKPSVGSRLRLQATMNANEQTPAELVNSSRWYRELWIAMATSLRLQSITHLKVTIDSDVGPFTKTMWQESFSHAKDISVLDMRPDQAPALAHAISPDPDDTLPTVSRLLFPRLALVNAHGATLRDIFLLKYALKKRAPDFRVLGSFIIRPGISPKKKPLRVVCVKPDGERSVFRWSYDQRYYLPGYEWTGFKTVPALEGMLARQRARKQGIPSLLSIREHERTLDRFRE
ncbi:unnamed protein product [Peniophora sp. CBMAI 1063]|nr:unnamed protein product [Peniophora sp. CBMAI 1063]